MPKYLYAAGVIIVLASGVAYLIGLRSGPTIAAEIKTQQIDVQELHN